MTTPRSSATQTNRMTLVCEVRRMRMSVNCRNARRRRVSNTSVFITRDSIYATARMCYRPSVCLSVCLSDGCIIEKRLKLGL